MIPENGRQLLEALYDMCAGQPGRTISAHEAGNRCGLDREQATRLLTDLVGLGILEIKTLSGDVAFTAEGVLRLPAGELPENLTRALDVRLDEPVLPDGAARDLASLLDALAPLTEGLSPDLPARAEIAADTETIRRQLESPRPKSGIIRPCLASLAGALAAGGLGPAARAVERLTGGDT